MAALSGDLRRRLQNALGSNSAGKELFDELDVSDDKVFTLGSDNDQAMVSRSTALAANTALTNVLVGTPVTPAVEANSLIISNITASGDVLLALNRGGNSENYLWADSSLGNLRLYAPGTGSVIIATGKFQQKQVAPATATDTATLTAANLLTGIIVGTPTAAATYTLPTGTAFEAEFASFATDDSFDFSIINVSTTAANVITVAVGTGWTLSGSARVDANAGTAQGQGRFRARRTAANTFTLYRIA